MNDSLPVLKIFVEAMQLPIKHASALLRLGLPLIIADVLLTIYTSFLPSSNRWEIMSYEFLLNILFCVPLVMAIVGCHRVFLIGSSEAEKTRPFRWIGNELRYAGWWILIALSAAVIVIPFIFLFGKLIGTTSNAFVGSEIIIYAITCSVQFVAYYVMSRWSLVLPASAIDSRGKSLAWSWRVSKGYGLQLTVLIGFLPFVMNALFGFLPVYDSILYQLCIDVVWLVIGVVEIGLLSLSYQYVVLVLNKKQRGILAC